MNKVLKFSLLMTALVGSGFAREPLTVSSAYFKEQGEFSCINENSFFETSSFWNKQGKIRPSYNNLRQVQFDLYFEYGVTQIDTLGLYLDYVRTEERLNRFNHGLGDVEIYWKHYLTDVEDHPLSFRVIGIVPSMICPTRKRVETVRYGEFGLELDLHAEKKFTLLSCQAWYEGLLGYRYYHGFPSDLLKANGIVGCTIAPGLTLIGSVYLDYGLYDGHEEFKGIYLTLPPRYRLLKTQQHCVLAINRSASAILGTYQQVWGQEIGTGTGYFGGLWLNY